MALPKIPDSILEKLQCHCGRYLSASPISVNQDGKSVCSQCVDFGAGGTINSSAYETMAELFQFPCRYKFKGCPKYMQFNMITEHEQNCAFRTYECPENLLTYCNTVDSILPLRSHYKEHHSDLYLNSPTFEIDIKTDSEKYYLTVVNDDTYLLQSKCSIKQNKLWLHANHFRNAEDTIYIHYKIKLVDNNNGERCVELEKKCVEVFNKALLNTSQAVEVDISAITSFFKCANYVKSYWTITMAGELKRKIIEQKEVEELETFEEEKENIKCPHCGVYMTPPIYRCDQKHVTCEECRSYYRECRTCQSNEVTWTPATDLEKLITKMAQYHCRWIECDEMFSWEKIRRHEQECYYRRYKCPKCNWYGIYDQILLHFKSLHTAIEICSGTTITFNSKNRYVYILAYQEMFVLSLKQEKKNSVTELDCELYYLGFLKFADKWKCAIQRKTAYGVDAPQYLNRRHTTNQYSCKYSRSTSIYDNADQDYQLTITRT